MTKPNDYIQGYAVIRIDEFADVPAYVTEYESSGESLPPPGPGHVTVKQIVFSADEARCEVKRLNELNAEKGCRYYWQTTHVFLSGGSHGNHHNEQATKNAADADSAGSRSSSE